MGRGVEAIRVLRIERHRPESTAREVLVLAVDAFPFLARVGRDKNTALGIERTKEKDLITIVRIDEDAREIPDRQAAAALRPFLPVIAAQVKGLRCADVDIVRPLRVRSDR